MKITLRNNFHESKVVLISRGDQLSAGQIRKAKKILCGHEECTCSGILGTRGPQEVDINVVQGWDDSELRGELL